MGLVGSEMCIRDRKYERYTKAKTKVKAHNPENVNAKAGQIVQITETRPLSKTKKFVVTKIMGVDEDVTLAIQEEKEAAQKKRSAAKKEKKETSKKKEVPAEKEAEVKE